MSAASSKAFPVLEPRTIKIPPLIVGKDSYGSNGKKFRYGPPPRYLPPMDTGLLPGARVPWTLSPSDQAVSGSLPLLFLFLHIHPASACAGSRPRPVKRLPHILPILRMFVY